MAVAAENVNAGWPNTKDDYELEDVIGEAIVLLIGMKDTEYYVSVLNKMAHSFIEFDEGKLRL